MIPTSKAGIYLTPLGYLPDYIQIPLRPVGECKKSKLDTLTPEIFEYAEELLYKRISKTDLIKGKNC